LLASVNDDVLLRSCVTAASSSTACISIPSTLLVASYNRERTQTACAPPRALPRKS
jgi:hypothetical protein